MDPICFQSVISDANAWLDPETSIYGDYDTSVLLISKLRDCLVNMSAELTEKSQKLFEAENNLLNTVALSEATKDQAFAVLFHAASVKEDVLRSRILELETKFSVAYDANIACQLFLRQKNKKLQELLLSLSE